MVDNENLKAMKELWDTIVAEKGVISAKHKAQGAKDANVWVAKKFPKREGFAVSELFKLYES